MSGERDKEKTGDVKHIVQISSTQIEFERDVLMRRMRDLLRMASSSSESWVEARDLLDPYLEYIKFRLTGKKSSLQDSSSRVDSLPDLLTLRETARILRVSVLTLKRWGENGILQPIRINPRGDRRFKKEDLIQLMQTKPDTEGV